MKINDFLPKFKELSQPDFFESAIIFLYLFSVAIFYFSFIGIFNYVYISLAFILSLFFVFLLGPKIKFDKIYWLFIMFVPIILLGFVWFKGTLSGDAMNSWLPWGKEIAESGQMPTILTTTSNEFSTAYQPLLSLFFAAIFSFFPQANIILLLIPWIFNILTVIFLYQWAKNEGLNQKFLIFVPLLFLSNYLVARQGANTLQEPILLFFVTAFFYFWEIYRQSEDNRHIVLLILTFTLAILAKSPAFFLGIPLFVLFFQKKWYQKKEFYFSLIFLIPAIFWFGRCWLIFGNPILPQLSGIFKGPYDFVFQATTYMQPTVKSFLNPKVYLLSWLMAFPTILAALVALVKKRRWSILVLMGAMVFFELRLSNGNVPGLMRHYYSLLGVLIVYGLLGLTSVKSRLGLSLFFLLGLLPVFLISPVSFPGHFTPLENLLSPLALLINFIFNNAWWFSLGLGLIFYFIFSKKEVSYYLILTAYCLAVLHLSIIQISWVNIWLPILTFIFLFFLYIFWRKEKIAKILLAVFIIGNLLFSSLGMSLGLVLVNKKLVFPNPKALTNDRIIDTELQKIEKGNRDYYIATDTGEKLSWLFGYKYCYTVDGFAFIYFTGGALWTDMTPQELQLMLKRTGFKYVVKNNSFDNFFLKFSQTDEYYEKIYDQNVPEIPGSDDVKIWRLKE
jgi:hypothetical protein